MVSYQNKPLVSVCIPTYNSARYLRESLNSIINQTYENLEIIVSDNASTDNTEEIVKTFTDNGVQFRRNPTNLGCYNNYNECLKVVSGKFVAFYHSDDIYEPEIVQREVEFLQTHPEVGAVFTLDKLVDENDKIIGRTNIPKELKDRNVYNFNKIYKALLKHKNFFLRTPTAMVRKSVYDNVGLFSEKEFGTSADLEMWLRILKKHPVGILNQRLMKHRLSIIQGSLEYNYLRTEKADFFKVMDYYYKKVDTIEEDALRRYKYLKDWDNTFCARNLLIIGEPAKAKELLSRSCPIDIFIFSMGIINGLKNFLYRIVLTIGINIGASKCLGKLLLILVNWKKRLNYGKL